MLRFFPSDTGRRDWFPGGRRPDETLQRRRPGQELLHGHGVRGQALYFHRATIETATTLAEIR